MSKETQVEIINKEINRELSNNDVARALLATTFKGLDAVKMKQAITEGMIRGFTFNNFLQKDVYAVPFGQAYSLVTSIDYARKIGMRSGIVGKDAPIYEMNEDGKAIISCTVTVHKKTGNYVGDFSATVYFSEFSTGANLWKSKPRVMIAKVAEMHALRMACPEEFAKQYIEEEVQSENPTVFAERLDKAKEESKPLKMGNLEEKNDKDKTTPENGDGISSPEGLFDQGR